MPPVPFPVKSIEIETQSTRMLANGQNSTSGIDFQAVFDRLERPIICADAELSVWPKQRAGEAASCVSGMVQNRTERSSAVQAIENGSVQGASTEYQAGEIRYLFADTGRNRNRRIGATNRHAHVRRAL
jgi:hypothetical protein